MSEKQKKSLYDEIKEFHKEKKKYVAALIFLGLLGLIFPVIPGMFLLGLGIALLDPKGGEELIAKVKDWFHSLLKKSI